MKDSTKYFRCNVCGYIIIMSGEPSKEMVCCGHKMITLSPSRPGINSLSKHGLNSEEFSVFS